MNYTKNKLGGARPARSMTGATGVLRYGLDTCCQDSTAVKKIALPETAAGLCHPAWSSGLLSVLACRRLRSLAGDSSISARIARKSSVAEITGKRITSTHPSASRHCAELNRRVALRPCHSQ